MTLTLAANIDATTRRLRVTGSVAGIAPGYAFRLDDELLTLQGLVSDRGRYQDPNDWYVNRGQDGSTAASHTAGADILGATDAFASADSGTTPPSPWSGGGGGQTADVQAALDGANAPDAGNVFATIADVPGGPGGLRVLDLGLVNVADLIDGPQTLYTPADGEFVVLLPGSPADFVQIDNTHCDVVIGQEPSQPTFDIYWSQGITDPRFMTGAPFGYSSATTPIIEGENIVGLAAIRDTRPFVAQISVQSGGDPNITEPLAVWQSAHGYVTDALVRGDGHIWLGFGNGDSGVSEPDWAAHFGDSVIDNDITWYDKDAFPTAGTLHVYAMVGSGGGGGGSTPTLDAVLGVSGEQDIADALTFAASPTVSNVFATMADVGGGSGQLLARDFLFTEEATAGVYTATMPVVSGVTVANVVAIVLGVWAADTVLLDVGDTDEVQGYFDQQPFDGTTVSAAYDPTDPNTTQIGGSVYCTSNLGNGEPYASGMLFGEGSALGPGRIYFTDDTITMTLTTTIAVPPVTPTGSLLVRVLYQLPPSSTNAAFE